VSYDSGTAAFTIKAQGGDFWEQSDRGMFVYQEVANKDFVFTTQVVSQDNTNEWAKSGLMVRDSLNAGARSIGNLVSATNGLQLLGRLAEGYWTNWYAGTAGAAPTWLQLERAGNLFTARISADGLTWTDYGTTTFSLGSGATIYVGLASTSHNDGTTGTNVFDNVKLDLGTGTATPFTGTTRPGLNFSDFSSTTGLQLNLDAAAATNAGGMKVLRITPAANDKRGSVFTTAQRDITKFTTDFDFQLSIPGSGGADGFVFVLQGAGADYLRDGGGGMGFAGGASVPSVAIKFDTWGPNTSDSWGRYSSTGMFFNSNGLSDDDEWGDQWTVTNSPSINMAGAGINIKNGNVFHVTLAYDGTTLTQTVTDKTTGAVFTHAYAVDIPAILGSGDAYVGFTGATGGANQNQDILSWSGFGVTDTPWVIDLTDGNDVASLKRAGDNVQLLNSTGGLVEERAISSIASITVNGKLGNDVITLDLSGGLLTNAKPITINGGDGSDTLKLKGVDLTGLDVSVGNTVLSAGGVSIAVSSIQTVTPDMGAPNRLSLKSLTVGDQTSLDVAKGSLILSKTGGTTAAQVFAMLASGRNGGAWNGAGLVSSTAAARTDGFTGLTMAQDVDGNVVVKYSWNGDVNQDELINADDYFYVDSGYITQLGGYVNGDLNFDGLVNADDYFLIDSAYIGQSSGLSADQDVLAIAQPQKKDAEPSVLSQLFSTVPVL
jgi:hypothetical protein